MAVLLHFARLFARSNFTTVWQLNRPQSATRHMRNVVHKAKKENVTLYKKNNSHRLKWIRKWNDDSTEQINGSTGILIDSTSLINVTNLNLIYSIWKVKSTIRKFIYAIDYFKEYKRILNDSTWIIICSTWELIISINRLIQYILKTISNTERLNCS